MPGHRIGLFGGTFNPIHWGHLVIAEDVRESFGLEKIIFLPSGLPPHKPNRPLSPSNDRFRMVEAAIADNPKFEISPVEVNRAGPSYTVETLRLLGREFPGQKWFLIVGSDTFAEIETWYQWRDLAALTNLIVVERPSFPLEEVLSRIPPPLTAAAEELSPENEGRHGRVFPHRSLGIGLSSSLIRGRVADGRSIRYLVPPVVEDYINRHKLYYKED